MTLSEYAMYFIGTPYVWGGNDVTIGVDCSGFVCEMARVEGLLDKRDLTAQGLFDYFKTLSASSGIKKDSVLFFGKSIKEITHVEIAINDNQMIGASGEGRVNTDKGYVRIRPIHSRKDLVAALILPK